MTMFGDSVDSKVRADEEVGFLPPRKHEIESSIRPEEMDEFGRLLTREDLMQLDGKEPIWRRIRLTLFILFWIIWLGLLTAAILIIVFTPKCPPRPNLTFWQSGVGYWVNPFAFRDSNGDGVGDIKGLIEKLDYVKSSVGASFLVLESVVSGQFTNKYRKIGLNENFNEIDPVLGTLDDFRYMVRSCRKIGLQVVLTMDFNSISIDNPWTKEKSLLISVQNPVKISRLGLDASVAISNELFYSIAGSPSVDLNLQSPEVVERLTNVTRFWLNEGVDGILLTNVAFYVEDEQPNGLAYTNKIENSWYKQYPASQIFSNSTVAFLQEIRKVIDESSSTSGKSKLLAVDLGNTGYGLMDNDDSLKFLGTSENPGAHFVVSRELVKNRGWKVDPTTNSWTQRNLKSYEKSFMNVKRNLALSTSTPNDLQQSNIVSLALSLLLPGTPLIYYGSELDISRRTSSLIPDIFYPKSQNLLFDVADEDNLLLNHLPMPWDQSGLGFSSMFENSSAFSKYLRDFAISETIEDRIVLMVTRLKRPKPALNACDVRVIEVIGLKLEPLKGHKSALAVGRGFTSFSLVEKLVKLRQDNPSLKWGDFELLLLSDQIKEAKYEAFVRRAEGFPSFIIVIRDSPSSISAIFDFSKICPQVLAKLIYPPNSEFTLNSVVSSNRIYIPPDGNSTIYVFQCA